MDTFTGDPVTHDALGIDDTEIYKTQSEVVSEEIETMDSDPQPQDTQHDDQITAVNREHRKMQDLFSALSFALRSFKNLNQVLELIVFVASHLTDADGGILLLFNANGTVQLEQLHCADSTQRDLIRTSVIQTIQSLAQHWLTPDTEAPLTTDSDLAEGLVSPFEKSDTRSWIEHLLDQQLLQDLGPHLTLQGTPLLIRNTVRGRLLVFSQDEGYSWTEGRQQLLRVIADQAAVAIENDELTAALHKRVALDKELEIGSEIQSQLLPRNHPKIFGISLAARCQAANKVGGDYYDFIRVPTKRSNTIPEERQRLGIVIGDVMGKGVPAGLLMTMTRGMLRAEVLHYHSPARILEHLNQVMFQDLDSSNRFISLFYSDYDPETHRLSFSNAAHNPTLWWHAKTHDIQPLDTAGPLIGLTPDSAYEERSVELQPGDVVVYYTDGFTEAANSQGERLEASGLEAAIQYASQRFQDPQAILECLFQQVEAFRGKAAGRVVVPPIYTDTLLQDLAPDEIAPITAQMLQSRITSLDDMTLVVLKVLPTAEA